MTLYADVIVPLSLNQPFSYRIPPHLEEKAAVGSRAVVPFQKRTLTGFMVKIKKKSKYSGLRLKEVIEILDDRPIFSASFLSFTRKLSELFFSSWGEILEASLPPPFRTMINAEVILTEEGRMHLENEEVLEEEKALLKELQLGKMSLNFLKKRIRKKNLPSILAKMEKRGWIRIFAKHKRWISEKEDFNVSCSRQLELNFSIDKETLRTAEKIGAHIGENEFKPFFVYGPREKRVSLYIYLIKKILEKKKKILFLVPEISLTERLIQEFENYLGERAVIYHSRIPLRKREIEWGKINTGRSAIAVGSKSMILLPLDEVGLIIVDEEQDESYYQRENPCYDARKAAWLRAKEEGSVLVYGSSAPTIESFYRAKRGKYLFTLKTFESQTKCYLWEHKFRKRSISRKVLDKIKSKLEAKEQVLIFINRRGYGGFLFCPQCDYTPRCKNCDVALSYHSKGEKLICHYCGYELPSKPDCPECGSKIIRRRGIGIETIEEELKKAFPQSKVRSFDIDRIKSLREEKTIIENFGRRKIDILVGTQFLAYRTELPCVSLVVILYPEIILTHSDFRASQRAYQTLVQMMKFAGDLPNAEIIIQTGFPNHHSIRHAAFSDYESFFKEEIGYRRLMKYPPYSFLYEVSLQGKNLRALARKSREMALFLKRELDKVEVLGPSLARISRLRGKYRIEVLVKSKKETAATLLREFLKKTNIKFNVSLLT